MYSIAQQNISMPGEWSAVAFLQEQLCDEKFGRKSFPVDREQWVSNALFTQKFAGFP